MPDACVVLLVCSNTACNVTTPLFMDRLFSPAVTIVLSVTLLLMFGEIMPQAVCSRWVGRAVAQLGPRQLLLHADGCQRYCK